MTRYARVALSAVGSAILLFSCADPKAEASSSAEEAMMTEYSEDLSIVNSQNGRRSYHFVTPLLEGYTLAREPYREFRKGIKITTYQDDSLSSMDAVLTANYAIYYENRELWEAKGNVVVEKSDGKTLYTQQLFWNARTGKIYSNVDSKIVQNNGRDVFIGEGFESDEEFKDWRFRRMKGRMEVEMKQAADSTASDSTSMREVRPASGNRSAAAQTSATAVERNASEGGGSRPDPRPAETQARVRPEDDSRRAGIRPDSGLVRAASSERRALPEHGGTPAVPAGAEARVTTSQAAETRVEEVRVEEARLEEASGPRLPEIKK